MYRFRPVLESHPSFIPGSNVSVGTPRPVEFVRGEFLLATQTTVFSSMSLYQIPTYHRPEFSGVKKPSSKRALEETKVWSPARGWVGVMELSERGAGRVGRMRI
nr:hypothetical protein KK1_037827 [Ipomoea trifida]